MRPRLPLALALAVLVLLAGCAAPSLPTTPSDGRATDSPTASDPTDGNVGDTATSSPTSTPTPVEAAPNPWGDTVVVAVENRGDPDRDFESLVGNATAYWERNAERYAGYAVDYRVEPNATDPDVVVTVVDDVPPCGHTGHAVGCAPLVTRAAQIDRPERVWVQAGLSAESTVLVLKHELGHTLGLRHDDAPREVMRASSILSTQPRPNATERAFPWNDTSFTVRIEGGNGSDGVRSQVGHALDYYEDGPEGMPDDLSFRVVDGEADIVVDVTDQAACGGQLGSCVRTRGTDPDGDGAIEEYTHARITVAGVDTEAVGWHVGYWLAYAFGAEDDAAKPPPFQEADREERRNGWWT